MTTQYPYNPSNVTANFEVFEKDDIEFIFGQPKAFVNKDGDTVRNYGIRIPLTGAEGKYKGKKSIITLYLHNEGGQSMAKRFQLGVLGYGNSASEEERFNVEQATAGWEQFNPDDGSVGSAWQKLKDAHSIASVDVSINNQTKEKQQQFKSWRPVGQEAKK